VFLVSLENGTSISWEERDLSPLQIIGIRMLKQVLGTERSPHRLLRDFEPPTPIEVLESVALGEGEDFYKEFTAIVVADGIQNFLSKENDRQDKNSKFYTGLTMFAELPLIGGTFIIPCCTATTTVPVRSFIASSHRSRVYLPLKSLDPPKIFRNGNIIPAFLESDPFIKLLLNDCGGHARALEALFSAITADGVDGVGVDNVVKRIHEKLTNRYLEATALSGEFIAVLRAVWIRLPLKGEDRIPGTELMVDQAVRPGLIKFTSNNNNIGYLTAPYLWVLLFLKSPQNQLDHLIRDWPFWDYADIYKLWKGDPSPGLRTWQNFEADCARIRAIKSKVFWKWL